MADNLKNKAVSGVGWSATDALLAQGINFIVGLILANKLDPHDYGLIGYVAIFIALFNCIVNSGFSSALIRKKNVKDVDFSTTFIINLVLCLIMSLTLFLCAPLIARFFKEPQLIPLTKVMSVIVIINAFAIVQRTVLNKRIDFKTQTKISFIANITSGVIGISMAFMGYGVWSLVGQQISSQLLNTVFLWIFVRFFPGFRFSWESFRELFNFGWKLMASSLIDTVWKEIYQIVIGKTYHTDALGQYTRGKQFAELLSANLTTVVQRVSYPTLSAIQDSRERLKNAYKTIIKVTMLVSFVLLFGLAAVAKPLIFTLIGEKWAYAASLLPIICFSFVLYPLSAINLNMLQVEGRSDLFLKLEIIKKCIAVIPILMGIFISIEAMLWGNVVTGLIAYYLNSYYSGKYIGYTMKEQVKDILPSFILAALMAAAVYPISLLNLPSYAILIIQVLTGAAIVFGYCELTAMEEYIKTKQAVFQLIGKYKNR